MICEVFHILSNATDNESSAISFELQRLQILSSVGILGLECLPFSISKSWLLAQNFAKFCLPCEFLSVFI